MAGHHHPLRGTAVSEQIDHRRNEFHDQDVFAGYSLAIRNADGVDPPVVDEITPTGAPVRFGNNRCFTGIDATDFN